MTFSVYSHGFIDHDPSYQLVTNIRLSFLSFNDTATNTTDTCESFFAISELTVNGSCFCNGRAENCSQLETEASHTDKVSLCVVDDIHNY